MPGQEFKRTLVTIMSIDVVGYTKMMGANEERTLTILARYRELIDRQVAGFDGRLFGVAGDSLMAEFASPVDAVRAAAEFQKEIAGENADLDVDARMRFRVGINTGDVIARGDDLFGDDVNIAARVQARARKGGIAITGTVYNHVAGKTDIAFVDDGYHRLKNVGVDVRIYHAVLGFLEDDDEEQLPSLPPASRAGGSADEFERIPGFDDRPALAVLPLELRGAGKENEYIADGIAEDLIRGLSKLRWFPVISRNSSFVFRGKPVDEKTIGRSLGARYLVQGSILFAGPKFRVSLQLVDAKPGTLMWSDNFDSSMDELFDLMENISLGIIGRLNAEIDRAEQFRAYSKPVGNLDTWDLVRKGMWHQNKLTREDAERAKDCFEEALEKDPNSVDALVQTSWWHWWHVWTQRGDKENLFEMEKLARWAMHMDHMDARPHMLIGIAQLMLKSPVEARSMLQEAVRRDPSSSIAHASIGTTHILCWEGAEAIEPLKTAMRLNPTDISRFHTLCEMGIAQHIDQSWRESVEFAKRSLNERPGYWYAHVVQIASLARSGQVREAEERISAFRSRCPNFRVDHIRWLPFLNETSNQYLIDGLQLAGYAEATS
ncbi:MAG: adenylate/guanylate cyclase domain-containing protein [Pseudomonadota bacterium]